MYLWQLTILLLVTVSTSLLTLFIISRMVPKLYKKKLEPQLEIIAKKIRNDFVEYSLKELDPLLDKIEEKVKNGVTQALIDLPNQGGKFTSELIKTSLDPFKIFNNPKPE